jgi:hypothetical protein
LEQALRRFLLKGKASGFIHFLGMDRPDVDKVRRFIVVLDHNHYRDQRDYRKVVEEVFAGSACEIVYATDPTVVAQRCLVAKTPLRYRLLELLSLIEKADCVICRAEAVEGDSLGAQAFVGLGIALGIVHPRLYLTMLKQDLSGKDLHLPSDLNGHLVLEYKRLDELKQILVPSREFVE